MNKRVVIIILSIVVFGTIGIIGKKKGWWGNTGSDIIVELATVERHTIIETVNASGKIQPELDVKISPEVSGEIIVLNVREGQSVEKGEVLLRINPDIYQSVVSRTIASVNIARSAKYQSEAQFIEAQQIFKRNETLYLQKVLSQAEWDGAERIYKVADLGVQSSEYQLQSALSSLKEAKDNLKRTVIRAPMKGIVTGLSVEVGERVVGTAQMAGTEMMNVSQLDIMEVLIDVNENDIVRVHMGDTAIVGVDAFLGHEFRATVTEISIAAKGQQAGVNQVTNFEVKLQIIPSSYLELTSPGREQPLLSGMTATVDIRTRRAFQVLCVPVEAVTTREDSLVKNKMLEVVFTAESDKAQMHTVTTGIQDEKFIQILSGIDDIKKVIRGPFDAVSRKLSHGDDIQVENPVRF
ncbi:MAG: Macrolide export protein MacA [Owenweeksia sp. TMED14]|nr:MAG: Macrolide export protein MacA [Owenweeksia sp. TMED14]|tara:strand:- start:1965 stop:3191 length:1227 start_codon:yes stop_codon:yes gene_type:complete